MKTWRLQVEQAGLQGCPSVRPSVLHKAQRQTSGDSPEETALALGKGEGQRLQKKAASFLPPDSYSCKEVLGSFLSEQTRVACN